MAHGFWTRFENLVGKMLTKTKKNPFLVEAGSFSLSLFIAKTRYFKVFFLLQALGHRDSHRDGRADHRVVAHWEQQILFAFAVNKSWNNPMKCEIPETNLKTIKCYDFC